MKNKITEQESNLEGGWAARMKLLMEKNGYNKDVDIELATVTSPPPDLRILIDNMKIELDKDDLIVAEHLTKHKRYVTIRKSTDPKWNTHIRFKSSEVTDEEAPDSAGDTDGAMESIEMNNVQNDYDFVEAEIEHLDELKEGDRVIVASYNNGQSYVILDRMVVYE